MKSESYDLNKGCQIGGHGKNIGKEYLNDCDIQWLHILGY
jgi:hypothetical protein